MTRKKAWLQQKTQSFGHGDNLTGKQELHTMFFNKQTKKKSEN